MGLGKTLLKVGVAAGAAYGAYYLYKNYIKKPQPQQDFDSLGDAQFDYDADAANEQSFADKIKAAAERQINKIK